jgi:hypothetical protein
MSLMLVRKLFRAARLPEHDRTNGPNFKTKAEIAAPEAAKEKRAQNPRPPRRPLPANLPVERTVEPAPCACGKCGSARLQAR